MLKEHPLGVGLFRFRDNIGNYSKYKHIDAHNFYVLTAAEMGPQGLVCLIILLVGMVRLGGFLRRNAPKDDPERTALALGFSVMTICVMLGNIYGSPFLEGAIMGPYWAMAGLLERYMQFKPQEGGDGGGTKAPREANLVEKFPLAVHLGQR
jgi:O-antigen ligase